MWGGGQFWRDPFSDYLWEPRERHKSGLERFPCGKERLSPNKTKMSPLQQKSPAIKCIVFYGKFFLSFKRIFFRIKHATDFFTAKL